MKLAVVVGALAVLYLASGNPVKRDCSGCNNNGSHYEIGQTYVKNCNTYECVADNSSNLTIPACEDPGNSSVCHSVGATWLSETADGNFGYCVTYECYQPANNNVLPYATFSNLQCRYKGVCLSHGESVDIANCKRLTCVVSENSVNYTTADIPGCVGQCVFSATNTTYDAGQSWLHNCYRYTCTGAGTYTIQRECCSVSFDGQVVDYPLGNFQIPGIPCNEYICDAENGFSTVAISCLNSDTGTCDPIGSVKTDGCFNYQCQDFTSYASYSFVSGGCYDSDAATCRAVGETWVTQTTNDAPYGDTGYCYHKTCSLTGTTYAVKTTSVQCSLNGNCYDVGTVQEYDPAQCSSVTCKDEGGLITSFSALCRDSDGNCHPYGSYGWPYVINGQQCTNCTCNLVGNTVMYSCVYPAS